MDLLKKIARLFCGHTASDFPRQWTPYPPVSGVERPSPQGWIDFDKLQFGDNSVILNLKSMEIGRLADTNSMDGFMDYPHILIEERDFDRNDLRVGDIVSYHAGSGRYIIHQITKIEEDEMGRLYTLQGTNNAVPDIWQVRNEHIRSVLVALIYAKEEK